jgi:hypothetical protein
MDLEEKEIELDSFGSRQGPMADCCEHDSVRGEMFLNQLSDSKFPKKDTVVSYFVVKFKHLEITVG